uniref:hypothetical protein n=1 Tax=Cellvibrio fontiphilus TaxID=1815559 RepID=UPI002B4BD222|nr:hypothetical protein [Cellvibrio fontiphilus]
MKVNFYPMNPSLLKHDRRFLQIFLFFKAKSTRIKNKNSHILRAYIFLHGSPPYGADESGNLAHSANDKEPEARRRHHWHQ